MQEIEEEGDGALTFEESLALTSGNKMNKTPLQPPLKADRRGESQGYCRIEFTEYE